jgi:hypothetical protein
VIHPDTSDKVLYFSRIWSDISHMNIFVLDPDPMTAATLHCDTHVVKMILETTQMLCTVHALVGNPVADGYKPTHANHPCTRWIAESSSNYVWAHRLLFGLHANYEHRYQRIHASKRLLIPLYIAPGIQGNPSPTAFVFAGPDSCIRETVVESYRALYRLKQTTMRVPMRWTRSQRPEWMDSGD